jgi:hyperosmotically inducible periplasmic protein
MRLISRIGTTAFLTLALGAFGACNRGPDPSQKVDKALKDANIDDVKVDWDKEAHVAHLTGTVDRATERQRAEEVATAAVGTTGRVLNEVTIKNVNDTTADDLDGTIRRHLKDAIDNDQTLRDRDINFDVNNGVVTVKGDVRTAAEKARVGEIIKSAPGVKDMANALEINPKK